MSEIEIENDVQKVLEMPEVKEAIQRLADAEASRQVQKFKENKLPTLIDEETTKRLDQLELEKNKPDPLKPWLPELDEYKRKTQLLEQKLEDQNKERVISMNREKALLMLNSKNIPADLIDTLVSEDEEKTRANVEKYISVFDKVRSTTVSEVVKSNNVSGPGGNSLPPDQVVAMKSKINDLLAKGKTAEALSLQRQLSAQ